MPRFSARSEARLNVSSGMEIAVFMSISITGYNFTAGQISSPHSFSAGTEWGNRLSPQATRRSHPTKGGWRSRS